MNHANITCRGTCAFHLVDVHIPFRNASVYERAHTLIGYCTTVTRRLIRKWSGQLCDDVNNNPYATILQTKLTDAPCKSTLLSCLSRSYRHSSGLQRNESDSKRYFTGISRELYRYFSHSRIFQIITN